jgi:exodeoxyribonuclease VII large subunit
MRAPTPSAAAEIVVPDGRKLIADVQTLMDRIAERVEGKVQSLDERIGSLTSSYGLRRPLDQIRQYEQRRDEVVRNCIVHVTQCYRKQEQAFQVEHGKLQGLSPLGVLRRGYSICKKLPEKVIVREARTVRLEDTLEITFHRGSIQAVVEMVGTE